MLKWKFLLYLLLTVSIVCPAYPLSLPIPDLLLYRMESTGFWPSVIARADCTSYIHIYNIYNKYIYPLSLCQWIIFPCWRCACGAMISPHKGQNLKRQPCWPTPHTICRVRPRTAEKAGWGNVCLFHSVEVFKGKTCFSLQYTVIELVWNVCMYVSRRLYYYVL